MSHAPRHLPPPGTLVLDHVSHFVPELAAARRALAAIGFRPSARSLQRTPDGPAGTANVCAMLREGYLEFLAPVAATPNAERVRAAMARHRGVHLVAFGTPSVEEERLRLAHAGFEPRPVIRLARGTPTGTACILVVRVSEKRMPEGRIQYVEHATPQVLWRPELVDHPNSVTGLAAVFVVARDCAAAAARWARFAALLPRRLGRFVELATGRGQVLLSSRSRLRALLGAAPPAPAVAGYALSCARPERFARMLEQSGCAVRALGPSVYSAALPPALGGACLFGTKSALRSLWEEA